MSNCTRLRSCKLTSSLNYRILNSKSSQSRLVNSQLNLPTSASEIGDCISLTNVLPSSIVIQASSTYVPPDSPAFQFHTGRCECTRRTGSREAIGATAPRGSSHGAPRAPQLPFLQFDSLLTQNFNSGVQHNLVLLPHALCEGEVIVQGDEGPVRGVAQVVGCHGVTVGHQEREEEEEQQEVESDEEKTLKERCACPWMG